MMWALVGVWAVGFLQGVFVVLLGVWWDKVGRRRR